MNANERELLLRDEVYALADRPEGHRQTRWDMPQLRRTKARDETNDPQHSKHSRLFAFIRG